MATARKRRVEVEIIVDDKGAAKSLKNIEGSVTKTGKAFSNFAKIAAGAFALNKVVDFGRDSVRAFSDLNESVNAVEVTFGKAAGGIKSLGEQAAESVGLSNAEFNSLAVGFSAFADKIAEAAGGDVVSVMETLTGRIADFASVMNLDVGEAAEKFRSGLAGETEPLRKFGIDVSAAAVNIKALELGLGDTSGKLSEQDKILARYNLIMDQTNKTAGDFAATSDDLANSMRILQAKIEDTKAVVGESLAPAIEGVLPIIEATAEAVGVLGIEFGILIGNVDEAVGTLRQYEIQTGQSAGSAVLLGGALAILAEKLEQSEKSFSRLGFSFEDFTDQARGLVDASGASADELKILLDGLDDLVKLGLMPAGEWVEIVRELLLGAFSREVLKKTQDVRDAVLDNVAAVLDLEPPDDAVAEGFTEIKTEAELAAEKIKGVQNKIRALTDPAFALIQAAKGYTEALEAQDEAIEDTKSSSDDLLMVGIDVLTNYQDLIFAADEYANITGTSVVDALMQMAEAGQVPLDIVLLIIDALNEADDFKGSAQITLEYIEKNKAALDRFLALNVGAGAPVGTGSRATRILFTPPDVNIPADVRAHGGPVTGGDPFIVGEEGPELFVPSRSGQIIPNGQVGAGGGVTMNFYVPGDLDMQAAEQIYRQIVIDQLSRYAEVGGF